MFNLTLIPSTGITNSRVHQTTTEEYAPDDPSVSTTRTSTFVTFTFDETSPCNNTDTEIDSPIMSPSLPSPVSVSPASSVDSLIIVSHRIRGQEVHSTSLTTTPTSVTPTVLAGPVVPHPIAPAAVAPTSIASATIPATVVPNAVVPTSIASTIIPAAVAPTSITSTSIPTIVAPTPAALVGLTAAAADRWYCVTFGGRVAVVQGWYVPHHHINICDTHQMLFQAQCLPTHFWGLSW